MRNHGGNHTKDGINDCRTIDFSASISPLGMHPAAKESLCASALKAESLVLYPEPSSEGLRTLLGEFWSFPCGQIVCGAGGADLIHQIPLAADKTKSAVILEPSFSEYESALLAAGFSERQILHAKSSAFVSENFSVIFACSPSNPLGEVLSFEEIAGIERECEKNNAVFVLDACFSQFSEESLEILEKIIARRAEFKRLVVLNAFTKFYGMAGLRLGYALCFGGEFCSKLGKSMRPWAVSSVAESCAKSVLKKELSERARGGYSSWEKKMRAFVQEEKNRFYEFFDKNKITYKKGAANYFLCDSAFIPAAEIEKIDECKVKLGDLVLRSCSDFFGLGGSWLRISVKSHEENDRLLCEFNKFVTKDNFSCSENKHCYQKKASVIMIQGTMSNAGKSLLVAALCRIFRNDGYSVAPFKSQNMALNSGVTASGLEMGRAQILQAEASGIEPDVRMNPILLKPSSSCGSQLIVGGEVQGFMSAKDYFSYRKELIPKIMESFRSLSSEHDIIVVEGAGSPAEINLKENDIVNMGLASLLDAPVILCGDIDRGGVFASLYGTYALLSEAERRRIKGFVINKFRGEPKLLAGGLTQIESLTGIPVLGVVPFIENLLLEDEDSLSEKFLAKKNLSESKINVFIVKLPYISNFTDFDVFFSLDFVSVRFFESESEFSRLSEELGEADVLILPGTKNTIFAMDFLRRTKIDGIIKSFAREKPVIGICGGFQLLGESLCDSEGCEGGLKKETVLALRLLPVRTFFTDEKIRRRVLETISGADGFFSFLCGKKISGYEIHQGRTIFSSGGAIGSCVCSGTVLGTYAHGFFDSPGILRGILKKLCERKKISLPEFDDFSSVREREFSRLEKTVRESVDMEKIYSIMGLGKKK
ncbi:MAG: cobyric acid synthase [Treponema sp.]|nr:cobyric acid synthase [Treponema sp.]